VRPQWLDDLQQEALRTMLPILALAGWAAWAIFYDRAGDAPLIWWAIPSALAMTCGAAWLFSTFSYPAAAWAFLIGSMATVGLTVWLTTAGEILFFAAAVVFSAGLLVGTRASLAMAAAAGGLGILATRWGISAHQAEAASLLAGMSALLAWLWARPLHTALGWAWENSLRAQERRIAAERHRAELMAANRSLSEAQYRIERLNVALTMAWARAEEARRLKAEFVANISHELRTPLNLIVGFSEMILLSPESYGGTPLSPTLRGDIDAIYRASRHLLSLIDDVLDLSQLSSAQMLIRPTRVDAHAIVTEAVGLIGDLIRAKGLEMRVQLAPAPAFVHADAARIRQVLLNLLNNALRFTAQGFIAVAVETLPDPPQVLIRVSDSGIGIPPEEQERIFEEFYQVDRSLSRQHGGVGLGLAISRRLVELHGGSLRVQSDPGHGTSFELTLPAAADVAAVALAGRLSMPSAEALAQNQRGTVIVAAPDLLSASFVHRQLTGCHVVVQPDLARAVEQARELAASALIAPEAIVDRPEALTAALGDIPLITCPLPTAYAVGQQVGAVDFLAKPITTEALLAALDRVGGAVRSLLIVDDEPYLTRLLARMAQTCGRGYRARRAHSVAEAQALIQREPPDVVLLDLLMPGSDGQELIAALRQDPHGSRIAVIAMTSKDYAERARQRPGRVAVYRGTGFEVGEQLRLLQQLIDGLLSTLPVNARALTAPAVPVG
jgi:signal transduction histidine kinase/CheY-like chemotaxis protein